MADHTLQLAVLVCCLKSDHLLSQNPPTTNPPKYEKKS